MKGRDVFRCLCFRTPALWLEFMVSPGIEAELPGLSGAWHVTWRDNEGGQPDNSHPDIVFNNFDLNCSRDKIFLFSYSFCSSSWFWTCSTNRTAPGLQGRASWHEYLIILSESKLREFLHPRSPEAAQVPGRGDRDDRGGGAGAARQGEAQGRGGGRGEWDEASVRGPLRPGQGKHDGLEQIFWLCLKWRSSYVRHWRRKARSMNQRIDDGK